MHLKCQADLTVWHFLHKKRNVTETGDALNSLVFLVVTGVVW
ncbi:unknown [Clostridium sp. CAG:75]|nr:unknown [Clostridium sp. CAG:75]